jgi:hypothetical protein
MSLLRAWAGQRTWERSSQGAPAACRFEETDPAHDEVVYARILTLFSAALFSAAGRLISDTCLEAIIHHVYSVSRERRRGNLLRRQAEQLLLEAVRRSFTALRDVADCQSVKETAGIAESFVEVTHAQVGLYLMYRRSP